MSKIIDELNKELAKAGAPTNYIGKSDEPKTPLSALVNGPFSVKLCKNSFKIWTSFRAEG